MPLLVQNGAAAALLQGVCAPPQTQNQLLSGTAPAEQLGNSTTTRQLLPSPLAAGAAEGPGRTAFQIWQGLKQPLLLHVFPVRVWSRQTHKHVVLLHTDGAARAHQETSLSRARRLGGRCCLRPVSGAPACGAGSSLSSAAHRERPAPSV